MLEGRVALITGAGRGIGAAIARLLCERGMKVAVNDLRDAPYPADITDKAQVEAMFDRVERELGPVWLLVNNAGVYHSAPFTELDEAAWDADYAVDIKGTFLCAQAAVKRMTSRRAGRIVNIASIAGVIARTRQISYCSAKAAAVHFTRCLAVEAAPHGITVNCVCPGMTRTEMLEELASARGMKMDDLTGLVPAGRLAEVDDHAHLVAFLASEEARHITGQVICVDGGQSMNLPIAKS